MNSIIDDEECCCPKADPNRSTATILLSGGAPNSTLMSGFLYGVHEQKKTFDNFYTSGAGASVAIMYLAAKNMNSMEAMKSLLDASISDVIWDACPVWYKSFFKNSPFALPFMGAAQMLKVPGKSPMTRLYNDAIEFWAAALTPSFLTMQSTGVCAHLPTVPELVDFDKLKEFPGKFYMNAYNITRQRMDEFDKFDADVEHFWAALAFPFVYESVGIREERNGKVETNYYSEGSDRDPINFSSLHDHIQGIRRDRFDNQCSCEDCIEEDTTVVLLDVMGSLERALIRKPRNFMDAYSISILTPIVGLAKKQKEHFYEIHMEEDPEKLEKLGIVRPEGWKPAFRDFHEIQFDIPEEQYPYVADWSYSNMTLLFEVGRAAGKDFAFEHGAKLPDLE